MTYISLHSHSQYSLLDSLISVDNLARWAADQGMSHVALTDHGGCAGHLKFAQACKKHGVEPILGLEAYVAPRGARVKEPDPGRPGKRPRLHHITLLAKNQVGLRNLYKLTNLSYQVGFYYIPRIDYNMLFAHHEGIICLSGCMQGGVGRHILADQWDEASELMWDCQRTFGDDYYLEVQYHGIPEQQTILSALHYLGHKFGIPLIATQDAHYIHADDWMAHRMLLAIRAQDQFIVTASDGTSVLNPDPKLSYSTNEFWCKTEDEMLAMFPENMHDAVHRTHDIAKQCDAHTESAPKLWEGAEWT